jgi:aspartyl-tRNA(Asn)/glutamyl-tRNA(Gln) amidotransferase subunit C
MNQVDTDGIETMAHPRDTRLRLRPDAVTEENQRDKFIELAPASENGLFLVPKVLD